MQDSSMESGKGRAGGKVAGLKCYEVPGKHFVEAHFT